jgi:hypothetical protein
MSFWKYYFDNDYQQRRDIEELREMQYRMATTPSGGPSERWVGEIEDEVKELAVMVRVMLRKLHEAKLLDLAALREEVEEELRPKSRRERLQQRAEEEDARAHAVACYKCSAQGMSNQMVRVGADWMCRNCAKNP